MSKYFDKDFLKFFLGFAAIISVSLMIIVLTRVLEERSLEREALQGANAISSKN